MVVERTSSSVQKPLNTPPPTKETKNGSDTKREKEKKTSDVTIGKRAIDL